VTSPIVLILIAITALIIVYVNIISRKSTPDKNKQHQVIVAGVSSNTLKADITLEELYAVVDEKMKADREFLSYEQSKKEELQKLSEYEQHLKLLATEGSEEAREFTRNKIGFILNELKEIVNINSIDLFIKQYHIDYFKNIYTGDRKENIKKAIDKEIEEYFDKYSISRHDSFERKLYKLSQIIYQELYGFSILDELVFDGDFNEVAANRYDFIWIQYRGIKRRIPNLKFRFESEEYYNKIVENRLVSTATEEMNAGLPIIYSTLLNGYRISASRPNLSRNFICSIRLFSYNDISEKLRKKFMGDVMEKLIAVLSSKGRRNVAIIGEQGSGKTTLADELIIRNLDDDLAIGLAENVHELNISQKYSNKNVIEFQYNKKYSPSDILEMFFRFNRDIIILGEVRSYLEAFEMIKAMLRQARGSLFTFHSSSVRRMVHDLRQLLMQTGFYTDYREAQFDIADAIDIVIQIKLDKSTGSRYVYKISEITADEEKMSYIIRDLFVYDKEKKKYLVNRDGLSASTVESCLEYEMTSSDVEYVKYLFDIPEDKIADYEYMTV
jgi:pilus assembly protein CpaF